MFCCLQQLLHILQQLNLVEVPLLQNAFSHFHSYSQNQVSLLHKKLKIFEGEFVYLHQILSNMGATIGTRIGSSCKSLRMGLSFSLRD